MLNTCKVTHTQIHAEICCSGRKQGLWLHLLSHVSFPFLLLSPPLVHTHCSHGCLKSQGGMGKQQEKNIEVGKVSGSLAGPC